MQKEQEFILRDEKLFNKFCVKENKVFGCQGSFGCTIACPLYRARVTEYLMNEKGMTLGEAHKACIRQSLGGDDVESCIRAMIKDNEKTISLDTLLRILEKRSG